MARPAGGMPLPEVPAPRGVSIRPARASDVPGMLAVLRDVAAEGRFLRIEGVAGIRGREVRRRVRRGWTTHHADVVAEAAGRVVGHLSVSREDGLATRHVASLGMAVARDWRGCGVGSALVAEAFRWARWAGVEKLALSVYPHNEAALALYRKFGFEEEGRLRGHSKKSYGYEDEIVMGRWL